VETAFAGGAGADWTHLGSVPLGDIDMGDTRSRWSLFLRVGFPLLVAFLTIVAFALPRLWVWADWDPAGLMQIGPYCFFGIPLGAFLLLFWWLALSGFRWRTRLDGFLLVAALSGWFAALVDRVEITGDVGLIPVFRWQVHRHTPGADHAGTLPPIDLTIDPARDFPRYRGPLADGVVRGVVLAKDWNARPPRELWRRSCGEGFAGFAVAGNVAVTVEQRGGHEVIVCCDAATGRERWAHSYEAFFRHPTGNGPRATPTIADGDVYSLGATGMLVCVEGKTGKPRWAVDVVKDNKAQIVQWGMSGSPLIVGDRVIVNAGIDPDRNAGQALAAYDRATGKRLWASGSHKAGYSSPQLAVLNGREQVLLFDGGGLAGFDPATGKELWSYPSKAFEDQNIAQPLVLGEDRVFISSEWSHGSALLQIQPEGDHFAVAPLWTNRLLCARYCNPVAREGYVYGLNTGYLVCLEAQTGARRWRSTKTYGNGQLLMVGDAILVQGEFGDLALVAADPAGFRELTRPKEKVSDAPKTWNTPALAGNRLFLRNHLEMVCYELPLEGGQ
jgi:outer membrane protein assembly factor BamB